jgi:hypothetical protein
VVYGLAESAGTLYVAGDFATIAGQARRRLAALDATTGVATAWDPDVNASASAVAVQGGTVFAGGNFWLAGGVPRSNLAALDLATGHPTAWAPIANARVLTMVTDGTSLYLGGYFTQLQGATHHYLARMDLASAAVAAWDPGASDVVTCLDLAGSRLYAGGYFLNMGGVSGPTLAAIDAASGVTQSWVAGTAGGPVNHIVADPAAGAVSVVSQGGFWRFSAADAHTIWSANIDGAPYTLAQLGSTLYVGGYFHTVNGVGRNYVAALDATTGGLLPWDPESDGIVNSLATDGTRVYASGGFANIGGSARAAVAVLDASTGIAGSYDAQCGPGTFANSVYLAAPIGADLFLTGSFGSCGNVATPGFARMPAAPPLSVPPALPLSLRLDVAPMPALTTTRVSWSLPTPGRVWLDVLDVQGRSVATLLDGAVLTAGPDSRMLDTRGWRPGVYLARLRTPTAHVMRRIVVER